MDGDSHKSRGKEAQKEKLVRQAQALSIWWRKLNQGVLEFGSYSNSISTVEIEF